MGNTLFDNGVRHTRREPDNPRQDMEASDLEPDDARQFIRDLMRGLHERVQNMPDERFNKPDDVHHIPNGERAKQYYGNDRYQLLSGIQAALREWDESGSNTEELKEKYGGRFVEGVEIGERLAVYTGSDFTFTSGSNDGQTDSTESSDSKFTFTQ